MFNWDVWKTFRKSCGIILLSIGIGTVLMFATYSIPQIMIKDRVKTSATILHDEGDRPSWGGGQFAFARNDNFTDALMLLQAYSKDGNIIENAMMNPRYDASGEKTAALFSLFTGKGDLKVTNYPRYWHGYLIILRPMLILLNYQSIRVLNMMFLISLLAFCVIKMSSVITPHYVMSFVLGVILMNPVSISMSLQFSSVCYITLFSIIVILKRHDQLKSRNWYPYVFLMSGILTSFFDLLTYPLVTLGLPLLIVSLLDEDFSFKNVILLSFYWGFGYVAMWCGKFFVAYVLTGYNVFQNAAEAAANRIAGDVSWGEEVTILHAMEKNLTIFWKRPFAILFFVYNCSFLFSAFKNRKKRQRADLKRLLVYLLVFLMPFAWYSVLKNHSIVHFWFTYRSLAIAFTAVEFAFLQILGIDRQPHIEGKDHYG